jgi:hypothetical protein
MNPTTNTEAGAVADVAAWRTIDSAPRDGTLLDVLFDPATAEIDRSGRRPLSMAEFYVPGSTARRNPVEPLIENVEFSNRHFRPVTEDGTRLYAILSVTLTHWRPARSHLTSQGATAS